VYLKEKIILLVSPQEWSDFYISKHNYAIELASLGNQVIFMNPPKKGKSIGGELIPTSFDCLNVLEYSTFFPSAIRFHSFFLYTLLVRIQLFTLRKKLPSKIDIVWCFEPNLFPKLNWFNAKYRIYHPVDFLTNKRQVNVGKTAHVIFSVADNILQLFDELSMPKYFVNHGLSEYYLNAKVNYSGINPQRPLKFAYIGSLFIPGLDRSSLKKVIERFNNVEFDFYGIYLREKNVSHEMQLFIDFLIDTPNVNLMGVVHPKELSIKLKEYDGFLVCYNPSKELNSGSNSHKMLEYLSLGKVIISSKIKTYEHLGDEILMSKKEDNSDYSSLFEFAVKNMEHLNSPELFEKRRNISIENSYKAQIQKIDKILCNHL